MTKFELKDQITNENGDTFEITFVTNRSYELKTPKHTIGSYSTFRRLTHEYVEIRFVDRKHERFDNYGNIIKLNRNKRIRS